MKKLNKYILTVVFLLSLVVPYLIKVANLSPDSITNENRVLAKEPVVDFKHLDKYPQEYEAYFNDNFSLRATGIKLYNNFNYFFLKKSPDPQKAILGKDGWLFKGENIDIYRGSKRFTSKELKQLEKEFIKRDTFLKKHNCRFVFVVIPNKKEIYPEFVPDEYFRYSDRTIADQLIEMLESKTNIEVVDLRPVLEKAKHEYPILFHKMDNHWNDLGTYFSYKTIIDQLSNELPVGNPRSINEFKIDTIQQESGNIAKMLGVADKLIDSRLQLSPKFESNVIQLSQKYSAPKSFPYPWAYEKRYQSTPDSLPRLMMINDSFGEYFYKFIPEHFSYSIFLFDSWEYKLHAQKVIDEKPDVFILSVFDELIPNILRNIEKAENQIPETI